jgi:hypothetical protein
MNIPLSASDVTPDTGPETQDNRSSGYFADIRSDYIHNTYFQKEYLTRLEALDLISRVSMMLEQDERMRCGG